MKNSIIRQIVVAVLLAIGFGAVWGFGLGAVGGFMSSLFGPTQLGDYEEIVVDLSGQPFIQVRVNGDWENMQYRSLEGQVVKLSLEGVYVPNALVGPYREPKLFEYPITWPERILGIAEDPPASWVLMRDDKRPGSAWFVGHQPRSRELVGYIGRQGLRTSLPSKDEQFDIGSRDFAWTDGPFFASTGNINVGGLGNGSFTQLVPEGRTQPWMFYLCDGDTVREINLRTREVRSLGAFDTLASVGILQTTSLSKGDWPDHRLGIRTQDRIVLFNPFDNSQSEFQIPESVRTERLGVSTVGGDQLLLHLKRGEWEGGVVAELLRINRDGEIQDKQTVKLVRYTNRMKPSDAVMPALLAPTLVPWLLGMFVVAPLAMMQEYFVANYSAGVAEAWNAAWIGLAFVVLLSIILTAIVYRWQQKYSRPHTLAWTLFVFLTTLPGFFAYWAMHRREPLAACPHCKHEVPRNREKCDNCVEPFPEPKLLGTEVFV